MLTKKELLNFKKSKGQILPKFISSSDPELLNFARSALQVFSNAIGLTRYEVEEQIEQQLLIESSIEEIILKGIIKLLHDRLKYAEVMTSDMNEFRHKLFSNATLFLKENSEIKLSHYLKDIAKTVEKSIEEIQKILYSDLPENSKIIAFKDIEEIKLLNRYNVSLVQGLLFYSEAVTIEIGQHKNSKADLRFLLRQLKFYQLVAYIEIKDDNFYVQIDGPISLFIQTQKYGFNLAAFFPNIVLLTKWKLIANIAISKSSRSQGVLEISEKSPLISHYKNFSSYIPEEFQTFSELFKNKSEYWKIDQNDEEILFDGSSFFFPDFKFINNNKVVFLELFHSWHKKAFLQRLENIENSNSYNLVLGVAKSLLKDQDIASRIQESKYFHEKGFIFREVPSINQVLEILKLFQ
ncbi:DUF790 family protein [Pigmentibacter sp. JX0631]|uniref:DUF790 family protein n=1 Tax=Pigmentibacter sp. JX0631 TaxID=2976982 RepID=UPI0024687572|nr:DUF790 family protein [Pigmentibacter sp. JX0631]WGL60589.1 DUF790 family protein [Pigmentibacter sp. JX0631]